MKPLDFWTNRSYNTHMTIGRPQEFDSQMALDCATDVFWTQGYEHTSLQDLLESTGLSKSSLYQEFGSKQELFEKCLTRYTQMMVADLRQKLNGSSSAVEFIEDVLLCAALESKETSKPRGCLIFNTATEFSQTDRKISSIVASSLNAFKDVFSEALLRAKKEKIISPDISVKDMAAYLVASISGIRAMVKGGSDASEARALVKIIMKTLR